MLVGLYGLRCCPVIFARNVAKIPPRYTKTPRNTTRPPEAIPTTGGEGVGVCFFIGKHRPRDPLSTPFYTREVFFFVGVLLFRRLARACWRF